MTKEEASKIKNDILEMEGSVCIGDSLTIDGVVKIDDALKIISKYTENELHQSIVHGELDYRSDR